MVTTLFLDAVWGRTAGKDFQYWGELRAFKKSRVPIQLFTSEKAEAMAEAARLSLVERYDVYFGVLRRTAQRGRAEDTVATTHLIWADFDAKNFRGKTGSGSAFAEIANMRLIPHIIVDSGHGYHAYWLLDYAYPFAEAQAVMKGIEQVHKTDHCSDAARILRVPGTLNFKDGSPMPVRLVRFDVDSRAYALDSFHEYAYLESMQKRPAAFYKGTGDWTPTNSDAAKFGEGQRNNGLARVAAAMVHKGMPPLDVLGNLLMENELRCVPPLPAGEVSAIAMSVERYRE